ncbi:M13 family metallopeptidase [Pendulispora albinea]|uniref:M13 family metallopeptidase n=1 Tax=Pendulispora albinea TaxID=2741071 RepID=A0ABZ2LZ53_9BACT
MIAPLRPRPPSPLVPLLALCVLPLASALPGCGGAEQPPAQQPAPASPAPAPAPVASAPPPPEASGHAIDRTAIDRSVKPGTDFFMHANGAWFAKAEIPADRNRTGVWLRIAEEIEKRTRGLLEEAARPGAARSPGVQRVGDFYASYLDEAGIDARGVAPLAPVLQKIAKIADARALATYLGSTLRADVDVMNSTDLHTDNVLGLWVEQDINEPSRYAPYLVQGGLGMPDRGYYLDESPRMQKYREAYVRHLATTLRLAGIADADAKAARAFGLEKKIAAAHVARVDSSDVSKGNNPWARADFATKAPGLDWNAYFTGAGLERQTAFIVWQPSAVTGLAKLVKSEPVAVWKDYLTARAVDPMARFLSKPLREEHFAFYEKELRGSEALPPRWRASLDATSEILGEAVGKMYVERYFPPETKRAVEAMVANIVAAFGRRIDALTWMSPATKAKAKEKLATLKVGVGYPDAWRDDSGLSVVRGDVYGNVERAELFKYRRALEKLGRPIDRGEWAMPPQLVNAVNLPVRNALNFPAAILSPPLFDPKAVPAANYGAIGAIIGHEISHSFDNEGAKFDARGRFVNWWTPEDLAHFEASGAALAAQFSAYKPFPDASVDGKLTLAENIADLAGLSAAYDAWRASLDGAQAPTQDGFSGDQLFFLAFAQGWQTKLREKTLRSRLTTDGHAPPQYRALTVRNLDPWYTAFDVKPGEALYLEPSARVRVW